MRRRPSAGRAAGGPRGAAVGRRGRGEDEACALEPRQRGAPMTHDDRLLLISADCHAGPLPDTIRAYVDPKHRAAFDAWLADTEGMLARRAEHTGEAIY